MSDFFLSWLKFEEAKQVSTCLGVPQDMLVPFQTIVIIEEPQEILGREKRRREVLYMKEIKMWAAVAEEATGETNDTVAK